MSYLVGDPIGGLFGIVALVDDVTDLLAVHAEVNSIRCQRQEGIVDVVKLKKSRNKHKSDIYHNQSFQ